DSGALLAEAIADTRPRTVWLAHLSEINNEPALAYAAVDALIAGRAIDLHVLPRHTDGPLWTAACVVRAER
ncbi:MAG: hypothetical protein IT340_23375, partial [Chloroflexi bacterium]|nr:hypothetical protein [Chloroflexota bacterium]